MFYLNIEERVNIDIDATILLNPPHEFLLILTLDTLPFVLESFVFSQCLETSDESQISDPFVIT